MQWRNHGKGSYYGVHLYDKMETKRRKRKCCSVINKWCLGYLLHALTAWYKISSVSLQNDLSLKMRFACFLDFLCEKESSEWKPGSKCIAQILKLKVERYTKFA